MKSLLRFWNHPDRLFLLLCGGWTLLNLYSAHQFPPTARELLEWNAAAGNGSYPDWFPFQRLLMQAGTLLTGSDHPLWMRLPCVLLFSGALLLLWRFLRRSSTTVSGTWLAVITAFSIPLWQGMGFTATPAPYLFFFITLTLYSYRTYTTPGRNALFSGSYPGLALFTFACAGLTTAHPLALPLTLSMAVSVRRKFSRKELLIVLCGTALCWAGYIFWLWTQEWTTVLQQVQNGTLYFKSAQWWSYTGKLVLLLHPLLLVPAIVFYLRKKYRARIDRPVRALASVSIVAGLLFAGWFEPQSEWFIPAALVVFVLLLSHAEKNRFFRRCLLLICTLTAAFFLLCRLTVPNSLIRYLRADKIPNENVVLSIDKQINGRPLITSGDPVVAAAFSYYNRNRSFDMAYVLPDWNRDLYGLPAAIALDGPRADSVDRGLLSQEHCLIYRLSKHHTLVLDTVSFYIPVFDVELTADPFLPRKAMTGHSVPVNLTIGNPYDFEIPLEPAGAEGFRLVAIYSEKGKIVRTASLPVEPIYTHVPGGTTVRIRTRIDVPKDLNGGKYHVSLGLTRNGYPPTVNSAPQQVRIVNPRQARFR